MINLIENKIIKDRRIINIYRFLFGTDFLAYFGFLGGLNVFGR